MKFVSTSHRFRRATFPLSTHEGEREKKRYGNKENKAKQTDLIRGGKERLIHVGTDGGRKEFRNPLENDPMSFFGVWSDQNKRENPFVIVFPIKLSPGRGIRRALAGPCPSDLIGDPIWE